jgi:crotonobetainyl-CoA:carnitine CoA-transferase CaiB-like acyl-CoA transferase
MGQPGIADPADLGLHKARLEQRARVNALVAGWTASLTRDEALSTCAAAEVPCGPVYAIDEIFEDEQYRARGNLAGIEDPRAGEVVVPNVVPRLSRTPGRIDWLGPALGAHTEETLGRLLGIGLAEIERLRRDGVV